MNQLPLKLWLTKQVQRLLNRKYDLHKILEEAA